MAIEVYRIEGRNRCSALNFLEQIINENAHDLSVTIAGYRWQPVRLTVNLTVNVDADRDERRNTVHRGGGPDGMTSDKIAEAVRPYEQLRSAGRDIELRYGRQAPSIS